MALTATTGFATRLLQDGMIIYKFTGIKGARYTDSELLERLAVAGDHDSLIMAKGNMQHTDALLIDGCSMLSEKTFEHIEDCKSYTKHELSLQVFLAQDVSQVNTPSL